MLNIFKNIRENKNLQKKIEADAKESERIYWEEFYSKKIDEIIKANILATQKLQATYEEALRTQEKNLKEEFRKSLTDKEELFKKDKADLNLKINELLTVTQDTKNSYEKQLKEKDSSFEKDRKEIKKSYDEKISEINEIFAKEIRELRSRLDDASNKLKEAQRGYFIYLKYAVLAFHYVKELRAESEAWVQHSITYKQRMESMHAKFQKIDAFNERTGPLVKEMLHYNKESDEELIEEVLKDFDKVDISKIHND